MLQQEWGRSVKCDQSENGKMARRARDDRVIEFPYLVMFRNENGHLRLGRRPEKEAIDLVRDELKTTVYVMEAVELYEPKESNK